MAVYSDLDKWAWDLEQELKNNQLENRSELQRKLIIIERIRNSIHVLHMKNHSYGSNGRIGTCPQPKDCFDRAFENHFPHNFNRPTRTSK
jgi:hypothetical protein